MIKSTQKQNIPLYYILEAAVNPADIKTNIIRENVIEGADGKKIKTVTADSILQSFETLNWNKRTYPGEVVMEGLDTNPKIQNDIRMRQWAGEWGHPEGSMTRMAQLLPEKTSHYIDKYYRQGKLLHGVVTTAPFGYGFDMYNLLFAGRPWAFSLRAFGGVDANNVALRPLTVLTFDQVNRPSHKEAYATAGDIVTKNEFTDNILRECSGTTLIESSTIVNEITNFVLDKSDNVKIARELFKLTEVNTAYDGNKNIILEGAYMGNTIKVYVPVETYIKDNYLNILRP